jgi:HEAT repeat protein
MSAATFSSHVDTTRNDPPLMPSVQNLIDQLSESDGLRREAARHKLTEIADNTVVCALMSQMGNSSRTVRWEAAKALVAIANPIAAPALANHLQDSDSDVRWLAAEGLAVLGERGLIALLRAAIHHANNSVFCEAVHHALAHFNSRGFSGALLQPLLVACRGFEPGVELPVAAYAALTELNALK